MRSRTSSSLQRFTSLLVICSLLFAFAVFPLGSGVFAQSKSATGAIAPAGFASIFSNRVGKLLSSVLSSQRGSGSPGLNEIASVGLQYYLTLRNSVFSPVPPTPTDNVVVSDSFASTDGVELSQHVGEVGASWAQPSYSHNSKDYIFSNRVTHEAVGYRNMYYASGEPQSDC